MISISGKARKNDTCEIGIHVHFLLVKKIEVSPRWKASLLKLLCDLRTSLMNSLYSIEFSVNTYGIPEYMFLFNDNVTKGEAVQLELMKNLDKF